MNSSIARRHFLQRSAGFAAALALPAGNSAAQPRPLPEVRVGIIGAGARGPSHVRDLVRLPGVKLKAVCDTNPSAVERVQNLVEKAGQPRPESYSRGEQDYKRLCARPDLDIVYVATPWEWHAAMCVEAMKNGKHAAVEVPAVTTIEECWQIVETSEATGKYCVMLENCCYDRVELMTLNMLRKGLLGEPVHGEGGYIHDLRSSKYGREATGRWRLNHSIRRNADVYPTHGLGPIAQCFDINRGNLFDHMVSMASKAYSLPDFARRQYGPESPQAKLNIAMGDVITSLIRTRAGQTIAVVHDTNTPHPYSRKFLIQGSRGIVQKYPTPLIYIDGKGKAHEWDDMLKNWAAEWEHPLWKELEQRAKGAGHGGMDYVLNYRLMQCLQKGEPPDMDVYDAAALSAVTELSERSIASRSRSVDFPDFTRGRWTTRKPLGIVSA
ncbi:MAG: Gfo/Idh/MocA family oxidoreductase [Candidatus Solibacter usitatus]|nr:Gfo/Idh/MocA family oxidoreductase [Candidatus Solibacter usitatus]